MGQPVVASASATGGSVVTWADGFGTWHTRVPRAHPEPAAVARRSIAAQIRLREGQHLSLSGMTVVREPDPDQSTFVYVEHWRY